MRTFLLWAWVLVAGQDPSKAPVPDAESLKRAEALIREIYKADYSKKDPGARRALARDLLQQARGTKDDPAVRYVLYRDAADFAAEAGDLKLALEAVDQGLLLYAVNSRETRKNVLNKARKSALTPEDATAAVEAYLQIAGDEVAAEDFDAAAASLKEAEGASEKLKNVALLSRIRARAKELPDLKRDSAGVAAARKSLAANPEDGEANLTVGKFLCLRKEDWVQGLPLLAKGADAGLKAAATRDLAGSSTAQEQVAAGDGWWDLSEKEAGTAKEGLRRRAAYWYVRALPELAGLTKAKVEKRLSGVESRAPASVDLLALIDLKRDLLKGAWQQQASRELTSPPTGQGLVQIPYIAPEEFDLRLVVRMSQQAEVNIGIALGEVYFVVAVDGWYGKFSGVDQIDGKGCDVNETARPGRLLKNDVPNTILCSIRKNRLKLEVNGEKVVDWPMDRNRLGLMPYWNRPRNGTLSIGSHNSYTISRYEMIPVTGQGKPLR